MKHIALTALLCPDVGAFAAQYVRATEVVPHAIVEGFVMRLRPASAEGIGICQQHRHESDLPHLNSRATLLNPTGSGACPTLLRSAPNG